MGQAPYPPPERFSGAPPVLGGAQDEGCPACFVIGLAACALSGAAMGFVWGIFVGMGLR